MKLLRYGPKGQEKPGLLDGQGTIRSLEGHVDDIAGDALSPDGLRRLAGINASELKAVDGQPRIGPCVGRVGKFICIGLNYADHAAETGAAVPTEPIIFMKATSAIIGPNDDVDDPAQLARRPTGKSSSASSSASRPSTSAKPTRSTTSPATASSTTSPSAHFQTERGGQWTKGKSCDTFGPIGPWLVTKDEVPDPQNLKMWLEVDGQRYQNGTTATMVFGVPFLVSYLSQFMSLQPGDVISTGTPPGVGMGLKPPVYLKPGQTIRLGIDGLGEQQQRTVQA